jgi:recombination protein RecR
MPALDYPVPVQSLIQQLKRLPGLGPRSAERLALWFMQAGKDRLEPLSAALGSLPQMVEPCSECGFFNEKGTECELCGSPKRDQRLMCVVEQAADVLRLERSGGYEGLYHVLGGKLSPLDDVTPEDLRLSGLTQRITDRGVEEVILGTGSDVEGEATAAYIRDLLKTVEVRVTRLAQGMPAGGGLDHVDELTLFQALRGRRQLD